MNKSEIVSMSNQNRSKEMQSLSVLHHYQSKNKENLSKYITKPLRPMTSKLNESVSQAQLPGRNGNTTTREFGREITNDMTNNNK